MHATREGQSSLTKAEFSHEITKEAISEVAFEMIGKDASLEVVGDGLEIAYDIEDMHVAGGE